MILTMRWVKNMEKIKKYETLNEYAGSNWNIEHTTKYIFKNSNEQLIEAGYFIHFYNDTVMKHVIELPASYGCPMKCKFCASSSIDYVKTLNPDEIYYIFNWIYDKKELEEKKSIVVAMTGIGDLYFTIGVVEKALLLIAEKRSDIQFTVSSSLWTEQMFRKIERIYQKIKFRAIQITYISLEPQVLKKLIGYYDLNIENALFITKIPYYIANSAIPQFRINYLMMNGINDSDNDFTAFISYILPIKEKVIVRISKLNITQVCLSNNLTASSLQRMKILKTLLDLHGINAYLFYSLKDDGMNCGQLLTEKHRN